MKNALRRLIAWDVEHSERWALRIERESPFWRAVRVAAILGARAGDALVWIGIGASAYTFSGSEMRWRIALAVTAVLVAGAIVSGIKLAIRRQRPPSSEERSSFYFRLDVYAFPSGHAARIFGIAAMMGDLQPAWQIPAWVLAFWVSASRVLLGVHHILDVVIGGAIGWGIGALARYLFWVR